MMSYKTARSPDLRKGGISFELAVEAAKRMGNAVYVGYAAIALMVGAVAGIILGMHPFACAGIVALAALSIMPMIKQIRSARSALATSIKYAVEAAK